VTSIAANVGEKAVIHGSIIPRQRSSTVYRNDPASEGIPRFHTFRVDLDDCGPIVLDALIHRPFALTPRFGSEAPHH
jgi:hypothetical protein